MKSTLKYVNTKYVNTKWCAYMIYLNYVISNRSILDIRIDNLLLQLILWNIGLIPLIQMNWVVSVPVDVLSPLGARLSTDTVTFTQQDLVVRGQLLHVPW